MICFLVTASAASLDLVELGGLWGTPNATDATALWWNPASLAAGHGTRFNLSGAAMLATVKIQRDDPGYVRDPDLVGPTDYDYGGLATFKRTAVVPFAGIVSDLGQPGLGLGLGVAVPHARGAKGPQDNVVRQTLVDGGNQAIYFMGGAAYQIKKRVSIGLTGALVSSSYVSHLYNQSASALNDSIREADDLEGNYYHDGTLEDSNYLTYVDTQGSLRDTALTFGAGVRVEPHDKVSISLAYRHGFRVDNRGRTTLTFDCPPNEDLVGRAGAQRAGLCHTTLTAAQSVGYNLPGRVQGGVQVRPVEGLAVEAFGAWVDWSRYTDFDIDIAVDEDSVASDSAEVRAETAASVSSSRQWARDARDTFYVALDGKYDVHERVTIGARILYDRAAVPTQVVSANNFDANTTVLSALVAVDLTRNLQLSGSIGQYLSSRRVVTDSKYALAIDEGARVESRYFFPSTNGTYAGTLTRLEFGIRGQFDHGRSRPD